MTTTSANGLVTTTQVDPSGAGVFDFTTTSTTVENTNGSSTVTQAETAANGSLINETVTTTSANGRRYRDAERQHRQRHLRHDGYR